MANLSTNDLCASEQNFVLAMQKLGFGHFEAVRVVAGEIALDPWPKMVQSVKFGNEELCAVSSSAEFQLKKPIVQFFERVRSIGDGEIRYLEVKHGLPFAMQVECASDVTDR